MTAPAIPQRPHGLGQHVHLLEIDESGAVEQSAISLVSKRHVYMQEQEKVDVINCHPVINKTKVLLSPSVVLPFRRSGMKGRMGGESLPTAIR